jgi:hypothetical protein
MPHPGGVGSSVRISTALAAALVVTLAAGLPADGFFSGDPGVKLIAARAALAHPGRPLEIDLPRLAGRPVPYVDRLFQIHGDHAHALQAPLFPVVAAPLIAVFGLRGAYVLPALSFVLMVPLLEALRRRATPDVPAALVATVSILASPLFFYAFEFWEHAPAAALAAGATVLAWPDPVRARRPLFIAGVVMGVAVLLRPEALWYLVALAVVARQMRPVAALAAGAAIVLMPVAVANILHSGNPLGPHIARNLSPLAGGWLELRSARAALWFLPGSGSSWTLQRELVWCAWPLGLLLLIPRRISDGERRLGALTGITVSCILLTAAHEGGAQWGPRFLLIAAAPMTLLSAAAAHHLWSAPGRWRPVRAAIATLAMLAAVMASRSAYRELRGAKLDYAALVAQTDDMASGSGTIVTDVWWFDQIAAPLYGRTLFLVSSDPDETAEIVGHLQRAGSTGFLMVEDESDDLRGRMTTALAGTCFEAERAAKSATRALTFTLARPARPCTPRSSQTATLRDGQR